MLENNEIISNDSETAKTFKNYFNKVVGNLDINQNLECVQDSFKEDPVLGLVEKYATHCNIKNIKCRMNEINSNFSFKFVAQDQFFKEIKKLDGNKSSRKSDIPIKIMKESSDIISISYIIT